MLAQAPRTRWGGIVDPDFSGRGYFRLAQQDGAFWLIDPDGGRFISKGINTVRYDQDQIQNSDRIPYAETCQRKYGHKDTWRAAIATRLGVWGINTLGAWSDESVAKAGRPFAMTPNLDLGMSFGWASGDETTGSRARQEFPDVFDVNFGSHVRQRAQMLCGTRCNEQAVIGWFIDNELRWGPDWRGADELLMLFLNLPLHSPGRVAALAFLRGRYPDLRKFASTWRTPAVSWETVHQLTRFEQPYQRKPPYQRDAGGEETANRRDPLRRAFTADCDEFAALVAERYFTLTCAAIRAADTNHLVLGCRFAYVPPRGVIDAAAHHADVISFNCYELSPSDTIDIYAATGKPCLIGEFSFRGMDSGLPNTRGAGPLVATQADRAACFRHYVTAAVRKPAVVGYHWFEHADQPAEGRFDGENSNFGTVSIRDDPYPELTRTMTAINGEAESLHAAAALATA